VAVPIDWYSAAFENSLNGIGLHEIVTDDDGEAVDYVFLEVNPSFERILGVETDSLIGKRVTETFPGIEKEPWIDTYGRVVATGEPVFFEQHSEVLQMDFEVHAYRSSPGRFVVVFHDITPYVAARHALEHSEALRRSVIESSADHIILIDLDGTIRYINRTVSGLSPEEVIGSQIRDYVDERGRQDIDECFQRVIESGRPDSYEVEYLYEDGRIGYFESRVGPVLRDDVVVAMTVSASDRTEHHELEERLRQSQKMEAIGRLAGGVAHDFNNLLTGIKGFSDLGLSRRHLDPLLVDDLAQISALVDQAGDLTHQLLAFSRRQPIDLRVVNINDVVAETSEMLRRLLGESFKLEVDACAELLNLRADRSQLQQILMNLAVNARDAMVSGGTINIETANATFETEDRDHPLANARCVRLVVSDNGPGIPPEALPHIFEPFYTTKEVGRGTGLGLATVYGIVRQHGGSVVVRSDPGRGARFEVYFPAVDEEVDEQPTRVPARAVQPGTETVMVVEDEDSVREVTSRILRSHGYTVIEAADSREAQRLFKRQPVDLIVTDVVMPGGDGPSLFRTLSRVDPALRVIYMSGYADPAGIGDIAALGAPFLRKPFAPDQLVRRVRACLDD